MFKSKGGDDTIGRLRAAEEALLELANDVAEIRTSLRPDWPSVIRLLRSRADRYRSEAEREAKLNG